MSEAITRLPQRKPLGEIERKLIGAVLALGPDSRTFETLAITGEEFITETFQKTWKAAIKQALAGVKVTHETIAMAGLRRKALTDAEVGELEALTFANTLTPEAFRTVAAEFKLHTQANRMAAAFEAEARAIRAGEFDPAAVAGKCSAYIRDLTKAQAKISDLTEDQISLLDTWDTNNREERVAYLPTGIKVLDAEVGGLPRALSIFAADAGVGKTALIDSMIHAQLTVHDWLTVGLISPEDGVQHVVRRWIARETGWLLRDIGGKPRTDAEREKVEAVAESQHAMLKRVLGYRERSITGDELIALCWQMVDRGAGEVVIDNFNKITLRDGSQDYHERVQRFSDRLAEFAEKARVPAVLVVHLSDGETNQKGKVTGSGGLQGGKALGRDARFRLDLFRKDRELRGIIAKANELGEQGTVIQFARQPTAGLIDPDSGEKVDLREERAAERKARAEAKASESAASLLKKKAVFAAAKAAQKEPEPQPALPLEGLK